MQVCYPPSSTSFPLIFLPSYIKQKQNINFNKKIKLKTNKNFIIYDIGSALNGLILLVHHVTNNKPPTQLIVLLHYLSKISRVIVSSSQAFIKISVKLIYKHCHTVL